MGKLNDKMLDKVSGGMSRGFVGPDQDTAFRDALLERKWKIEDREWELKVWQAYQENGRQWTKAVTDVIKEGVKVGAAIYTGGASLAAEGAAKKGAEAAKK